MSHLRAKRDDVIHAYRLFLGREPDPGGLEHYSELVRAQEVTVDALARMFYDSAEFTERVGRVVPAEAARRPPASAVHLASQPCRQREIDSASFRYWAARMGLRSGHLHRKAWEWCFIAQALFERGALAPCRRGLGFAVGQEPLTALFASMGCQILATDLESVRADKGGWVESGQHAAARDQINVRSICGPELFDANVSFRTVDMRSIPPDLSGFDFLWSSCAMEHLGDLGSGGKFVRRAMTCLRPGGVAIHTTEFNTTSPAETIETGPTVLYRKRDLAGLKDVLESEGHSVASLDFDTGDSEADRFVDEPPYTATTHLKLRTEGFVCTSFGLIIEKGA